MSQVVSAVIVAAGNGKRMNSVVPKQFIEINGKPVLYYTLKAFESSNVDEIIIVTSKEYVDYVREDIIQKYEFNKISAVVEGGKERYHSVYRGLLCTQKSSYVLIHDAARPFITKNLINTVIEQVEKKKAVIVGVPVKDTIKIVEKEQKVASTPERSSLWSIQTPQAFEYKLLKESYEVVMRENIEVTDDAMVVEYASNCDVYVMEGSYENIKLTTPEDLKVAQMILK